MKLTKSKVVDWSWDKKNIKSSFVIVVISRESVSIHKIIKTNFSQVNNCQICTFYKFSHLKRELRNLKNRRYNRTRRSLSDHPSYISNENDSCARCQTVFGKILNRGAPCLICDLKICKNCRELSYRTNWICIVCQKQMWVADYRCQFHYKSLFPFLVTT